MAIYILILLFLTTSGPTYANFISRAISKGLKQTLKEMDVEDKNSVHKIDNHLERRLIVMPLSDEFNPSQASEMHGKIQHGDKCSIPGTLGRLIFEKPYEVPWLFEVIPVRSEDYTPKSKGLLLQGKSCLTTIDRPKLAKAYVSPLDFRSPENYIFLPQWLMDALDLQPNDEVDVSFVRIKLATLITLQPLSLEWDELIAQGHNPKTVLEHEVNKYSSLTAGTVITIEFKGIIYPLYVKEVRAEGNLVVKGVRIQDSDVKVDIDRELIDKLIEEKENESEDEDNDMDFDLDEDEDEDD
jgi:hypothetical protein